jgi:peptidoglycan/LPS O-acetylase OafA/YrhL
MLSYTSGDNADDRNISPSNAAFYQNRFAHTYPTYFATMLFALPLWWAGYYGAGSMSHFINTFIASTLLLNTASYYAFGGVPIDGPGWTICTLAVFWLMFPYSAKKAQRMEGFDLANGITFCFYAQMLLVFLVFLPLAYFTDYTTAFAFSTMVPWTRYPVFLMGVYAGELCRRHAGSTLHWPENAFHFFPMWLQKPPQPPFVIDALLSTPLLEEAAVVNKGLVQIDGTLNGHSGGVSILFSACDIIRWQQIADRSSTAILSFTVLIILANSLYCMQTGGNIRGGVWLQAIAPFLQLKVIVALTRDGAGSLSSRILRHPFLLWLGEISMSLYLVHHPVLYYTTWMRNCVKRSQCGPIHVPTGSVYPSVVDCASMYGPTSLNHDTCQAEVGVYIQNKTVPLWALPVVVAVAIPLAALINRYVEAPCRRALRAIKGYMSV